LLCNYGAIIAFLLLVVVSAVSAADNDIDNGDLPNTATTTTTTTNNNNEDQLRGRQPLKKALASHGFPEDNAYHASCHMTVLLPSTTCSDAKAEAENMIETNVDTGEGSDYKGTMSIHGQGNDWIWSSRLTHNEKYTDDQLFEFGTPDNAPDDSRKIIIIIMEKIANHCCGQRRQCRRRASSR